MGSNMMGTEVQPIKLVETAKPKNTVKFSIPVRALLFLRKVLKNLYIS